jgi:hypothetical protein
MVKFTVPDEVDPDELISLMADDFFYANRETEDFGPLLGHILFEVVK